MSCLHLASRAARAQDSFQFRVSYDLSLGVDTAPSFYFIMGASSIINPITVMRHHLQSTINYTDCICRPNTGRRNRYVRLSIYNRFIFILTDAYSRLTTGSNDTFAAPDCAAEPERMSRTKPIITRLYRMRINRGRGTISQRRQQRSKVASVQTWYSGCQTKLPDNTTTTVGNHASFYAILRLRFGYSSLSSS